MTRCTDGDETWHGRVDRRSTPLCLRSDDCSTCSQRVHLVVQEARDRFQTLLFTAGCSSQVHEIRHTERFRPILTTFLHQTLTSNSVSSNQLHTACMSADFASPGNVRCAVCTQHDAACETHTMVLPRGASCKPAGRSSTVRRNLGHASSNVSKHSNE